MNPDDKKTHTLETKKKVLGYLWQLVKGLELLIMFDFIYSRNRIKKNVCIRKNVLNLTVNLFI